jgi:hypothetical protein
MIEEQAAGRLAASYLGITPYAWTSATTIVRDGTSLGNWLRGALAGMFSRPVENLIAPAFPCSVR